MEVVLRNYDEATEMFLFGKTTYNPPLVGYNDANFPINEIRTGSNKKPPLYVKYFKDKDLSKYKKTRDYLEDLLRHYLEELILLCN